MKRRFARLRRYRHIMAVLMKYGFEEVAAALRSKFSIRVGERAVPMPVKKVAEHRGRPERVRLALQELGPTFIKLGQLLSTRPDLVPHTYIKELERLQDEVAPEDSDKICAEIEKELGGKLEEIFTRFDRSALAAGSIAQVHRATTVEGDEVAVKVRRPKIAETIGTECGILEDLSGLLKATLFEQDTVDPQQMVAELIEAVSKEADLANERNNQQRFYRNFEHDPAVHVPKVYEKYCTGGVLTMEYIDGIKPGSVEKIEEAGLNPQIIAQRGANFVLRQIFDFGFFHTDPHPGNFFILPDNVLVPIDFGQASHLSSQDRVLLNEAVMTVVDNEAGRIIRALEREELVGDDTDVDKLMRETEAMLDNYRNLPLKDIPFGKVIIQVFDVIRKHHVRPPTQFTLMLKSMMTIESFGRSLDPEFDIIENLKPYARRFNFKDIEPKQVLRNMRKALQGAGDFASRFPEDFNAILSKFRQGKFQMRIHHEHLENLNRTLDKSSNRLSFALIIAALLIGSSLLVGQDGTILGLFSLQTMGIVGYIAAAFIGIWLVVSIIRGRHY